MKTPSHPAWRISWLPRLGLFLQSCIMVFHGLPAVVRGQPSLADLVDANSAHSGAGAGDPAADASVPAAGQADFGAHRMPPPDQAKTKVAIKKVREIFATDIAAASTDLDRQALSKTLAAEAGRTTILSEKWALWNEAIRYAIDAGELDAVAEILAELDQVFAIERSRYWVDALTQLAAKAPMSKADSAAAACIAESQAAATDGRFSDANTLVLAAQKVAQKTRNQALQAQCRALVLEYRQSMKAAAQLEGLVARYKEAPNDAEAALALGSHYCFELQEWEKGLPLLAKGSDADLAQLARNDLASNTTASAALRAADAWIAWARRQKPTIRISCNGRAGDLYALAIGGLQGLERTRVEKQLQEILSNGPEARSRLWVADAEPAKVSGVALGFTRDGTYQEKPFSCAGEKCSKSLRAMPNGERQPATVLYVIPAGTKRLKGAAGVFAPADYNPALRTAPRSPLFFEVRVDGQLAWKSRGLTAINEMESFDILVVGGKQIEFVTIADSPYWAYCAWVNPVWLK